MLRVEKSDIDQLVLGYVAEERYFQTRNQLFRESPNLPEKVPILSTFGDISSENRLHTILQEYVELKTRQLLPGCAACKDSSSLADMWKVFDRIVKKIRNFKLPEPPPPAAPPEMRCFSPTSVLPGTNRQGNTAEATDIIHRKKLNHLSSEYEPESADARKSSSGSAKRKRCTIPKRITKPSVDIVEPYAHNGDLSKLLHTSDKNDALALVGVKILTNMKKCAEKGSTSRGNLNPDDPSSAAKLSTEAFSPLKSSYRTVLDIDDLTSDETRGGLVEMTIDSLLNSNIPGRSVASGQDPRVLSSETSAKEDFSELRKLLEFDDADSNLVLPDLMQIQQDERDLIDIIKSDDNLEIPGNPIPMEHQASHVASEHSEEEKHAVAGLLAIHTSIDRGNVGSPPVSMDSCGDGSACTTPKISNVRSENDAAALMSANTDKQSLDFGERSSKSTKESLESRPVAGTEDERLDSCASMPPKKRFLVKETRTPEKFSHAPKSRVNKECVRKEMSDSSLASAASSSVVQDIISTAACLSNLELPLPLVDTSESNLQIVTSPDSTGTADIETTEMSPKSSESNDDSHIPDAAESAPSSDHEIGRSKKTNKRLVRLKDTLCTRHGASSKGKRPRAVTPKKSKKTSPEQTARGTFSNANTLITTSLTESKMKVLKPGRASVVVKLKDCSKMPIAASGVIVQSKKNNKVSKEDIINELVSQVQKGKSKLLSLEVNPTSSVREGVSNSNTASIQPLSQSESASSDASAVPQIHVQPPSPQTTQIVSGEKVPVPRSSGSVSVSAHIPPLDQPAQTRIATSDETSQMLSASTFIPLSEDSLMAALDISFLPQTSGDKDGSEVFSKTPSKAGLQEFSTISPGGVFSVVVGKGSPVKPSKLHSAKSNLLKSFLEEEKAKGVIFDSALAQNALSTEHMESGRASANQPGISHTPDSILPVKHVPMMSTPVVPSKELDQSQASKPAPPLSKRNAAKTKPDIAKHALLHKRPRSGILMCSKMKNMVRIEPKRHGVPAVKRYIVQGGLDKSGPDGVQRPPQDANSMGRENNDSMVAESRTKCLLDGNTDADNGREHTRQKSHVTKTTCPPEGQGVPEISVDTGPENASVTLTDEKKVETDPAFKKSKRKGNQKSKDKKRSKRLKLSRDGGPVMKWTYSEIQSKLDSIHGKSNGDISTKADHNESDRDIMVKNKEEGRMRLESREEVEIPPDDSTSRDPEIDTTKPGVTASDTQSPATSIACDSSSSRLQVQTSCLTNETSVTSNVDKKDSSGAPLLSIPEESLWPPFNIDQIEPLDLSLTSWLCNSKSPLKVNPSRTGSNKDCVCDEQNESNVTEGSSIRQPLKEVPGENSRPQKKSSSKKKSSKKLRRLEEKLKKVDLSNMDISKFLDSLDYHES